MGGATYQRMLRGKKPLLMAVSAVGCAALIAVAVALDAPVKRLGDRLDNTLWDHVGKAVSDAAQLLIPFATLSVLAVLGLAYWRRSLVRLAARAFVVLALSGIVSQGVKYAVGKPRPSDVNRAQAASRPAPRGQSMPSGHTLSAFALVAALGGRSRRWWPLTCGIAVLVGLSRLVVGAHYPSDVAVGAVLGTALGLASQRFRRWPPTSWLRWFRSSGARLALVHVVVLTALTALLDLHRLKATPLIDRDEPRFVQCAYEMLTSGDFIVPRFNGAYRFEKPPLAYWAMGAASALGGLSASTARLPSVVWAAVAVLLTYGIGRRLWDRTTAFVGAFILLSSLQLTVVARAATADALLLALLTGAFYAAVRLRGDGRPIVWAPTLAACLGLSNLAKGPVGLGLFAVAAGAFLFVSRIRRVGRPVHWLLGIAVFLAVSLPWPILVQAKTDGAFLRQILSGHLLAHAAGAKDSHGALFLIYLPMLLVFFAPWSMFLPRAVARRWQERHADPASLFLLSWLLPGFLYFCLIGTKLPHYLLPLYPAMSLLVARRLVEDVRTGKRATAFPAGRMEVWGVGLLTAAMAVGLMLFAVAKGFPAEVLIYAASLSAFLLGAAWWTTRLLIRRRLVAGLAAAAAATYLSVQFLVQFLLPKAVDQNLSDRAAPALKSAREQGYSLAAFGYEEPSLVWALRGGIAMLTPPPEDTRTRGEVILSALDRARPLACLIRDREYRRLKANPALDLRPLRLRPFSGLNFGNLTWEEARLVEVRRRATTGPATAPAAPPDAAARTAPPPR
jgi:4-amino-4-deoxy-L-arabinose transferase-like glycosyltransferase/membrane-associated phospholipid phosphatase